jgi:geranylgeranyl pyrophosphate synthase
MMPEVDARMRHSPGHHNENLYIAIEHLLSSGGKRVRPTITLLTAGMLNADHDRSVTLAAAIEMLHTASLVHDDLIDGALLRRGIPTLNAQWTAGATVLTGDYVFARAAFLAAQTGSLAVMELFAQTLMTIVNGEINQLFRTPRGDVRQDYFERIYAKTASLFELATTGSALLCESDPGIVEKMRAFGYNIGVAFQIVDDVLDFTGDQRRVGKPLASDLRQGLITLPTLCYLESTPNERQLYGLLDEQRLEEADLDRLIESIRSSDAIDQALKEAESFAAMGEELLEDMPATPEREALADLARYVVRRTL